MNTVTLLFVTICACLRINQSGMDAVCSFLLLYENSQNAVTAAIAIDYTDIDIRGKK